jgi:hypothetical protein
MKEATVTAQSPLPWVIAAKPGFCVSAARFSRMENTQSPVFASETDQIAPERGKAFTR